MRSSSCNTTKLQLVELYGDPYGTRTRIVGLRGRCPGRIDEGTMGRNAPLVIRAGLEPSITALKELCPDHLDERTRSGRGLPGSGHLGHQNIIDADMEQRCKNDQIVNGGQCRAVLPFVDGLGRIEAENHLQVIDGKPRGLAQIHNVGAGPRQVDHGNSRHSKHLLY